MSKSDRKGIFILVAIGVAYLIWQEYKRDECHEGWLPHDPRGYEDCLWVEGL